MIPVGHDPRLFLRFVQEVRVDSGSDIEARVVRRVPPL